MWNEIISVIGYIGMFLVVITVLLSDFLGYNIESLDYYIRKKVLPNYDGFLKRLISMFCSFVIAIFILLGLFYIFVKFYELTDF